MIHSARRPSGKVGKAAEEMVQSEPEHRAGRSVAGKTTFGPGSVREE